MAAVTQQLLLRELAPGTPGSAGTADPEQAPGAAQGWARLGKAGAVLGSEVPVPPSPSLLTSGPAHLVWGEHTPVRDCWELKSMCLAYFSTQILLLFLFFLSLPPTIIPRPFGQSCALHSEVMPDTFWSLDKILDARVVPMESALAPGMGYAPGRGGSRGRMRSSAAAPTCLSLLPAGRGLCPGLSPSHPVQGTWQLQFWGEPAPYTANFTFTGAALM